MKRTLITAIASSFLALLSPAQAQLFDTPASHAVIVDHDTGIVLYNKNADEPMPPASMSKLMTMLMVFERLEEGSITLDTEFEVSENAWRKGGFASGSSTMCLEPRERVSVRDLIRGVVVLSGNDASIVLAEALSGSEETFAREMSLRAQELGLSQSSFTNATGLPDENHKMSARDLATLASHIIREHPDYFAIYAEREFGFCTEAPSNRFNRNPLLGLLEGADGMKTGHTDASGYGLVGTAMQDGERRIVVFNGAASSRERTREAQRLMQAAFRDFVVIQPFERGQRLEVRAPVSLGKAQSVSLIVDEPIALGVLRRAQDRLTAKVVFDGPVTAPIRERTPLGQLVITGVEGEVLAQTPVLAGETVAKQSYLDRALSGLIAMIRS